MINLNILDINLPNSVTYSRRTSYRPIDDIYLRVLNIAMKSSSCTGTRLNWRRNSKKQDDSVEGLMLCYVYRTSQLLLLLSAQYILVRWERGSSQRRALWSVENEALPRSKALWSAESEVKSHGKISNFPTFLLYLDYELLLRSLRSLRSNNDEASKSKKSQFLYSFKKHRKMVTSTEARNVIENVWIRFLRYFINSYIIHNTSTQRNKYVSLWSYLK